MRRLIGVSVVALAVGCSAPAGTSDGGATGGGSAGTGGGAAGGRGGGSAGGAAGGQGGGSVDAGTTVCTQDGECASGLCRLVSSGAPKVCVTACTQQSDCSVPNTFCNPLGSAGGGYCVPRSSAHCLDCTLDSDCGVLSEVCTSTATDPGRACHVDCSLAGAAACPPEYSCTAVTVSGASRMLCTPTTTTCANASGGWCDSTTGARDCNVVVPDAGSCPGQRYCAGGRYDLCAGLTPACRADCATPSQTGCTEEVCPAGLQTAQNCGVCGNACPGLNAPNADAVCGGGGCSFNCQGENYDVNNSETDGCEVADAPTGNHDSIGRTSLGSVGCADGNGHTVHHDGKLPSDSRTHANPAVTAFSAASGSAPDELTVFGSGGWTCLDDIGITLTVTGSSSPTCYRLHIVTTDVDKTCDTQANGACTITSGSGSYDDNSDLLFTVSKTCSSATRDAPSYTVDGHI